MALPGMLSPLPPQGHRLEAQSPIWPSECLAHTVFCFVFNVSQHLEIGSFP